MPRVLDAVLKVVYGGGVTRKGEPTPGRERAPKRDQAEALRMSDRTPGQVHAISYVLERYRQDLGPLGYVELWAEIAKLTGLSSTTVRGFFSGDHWPQAETLAKLADGLGEDEKWIQVDLVKPIDEPKVHPWITDELYRLRVANAVAEAMIMYPDGGPLDYRAAAKLAEVDDRAVRQIIYSDPTVPFDRVQRVCRALGIDLDAISLAPPVAVPRIGA